MHISQKVATDSVEVATDAISVRWFESDKRLSYKNAVYRLGKTAFFLFILFYFFVNDHFGAYTVSQVS